MITINAFYVRRSKIMKTRIYLLVLGGVMLCGASGLGMADRAWADDGFYVIASRGPQGLPGASLNPLQIAILRWYPANQALPDIAVGEHPTGIAFDGANIWVASHNSNNVSKLRASDGALLGTYAVGGAPQGVAFDGVQIWVANFWNNSVSRR
jgi:DNA-binding beta-propeller fold protein YncE